VYCAVAALVYWAYCAVAAFGLAEELALELEECPGCAKAADANSTAPSKDTTINNTTFLNASSLLGFPLECHIRHKSLWGSRTEFAQHRSGGPTPARDPKTATGLLSSSKAGVGGGVLTP
jgi:hypothetical protein